MKKPFLVASALIVLIFGINAVSLSKKNEKSKNGKHPYQKLYAQKCQSCHGKDGLGKAIMAKALKVDAEKLSLAGIAKKSDEAVTKITAEGIEKMPGYAKKLKEEQIEGLTAYMRTLFPAQKTEETADEQEAKETGEAEAMGEVEKAKEAVPSAEKKAK